MTSCTVTYHSACNPRCTFNASSQNLNCCRQPTYTLTMGPRCVGNSGRSSWDVLDLHISSMDFTFILN